MRFENTKVFNFEGALRGMRNPLNSHDRSDSRWEVDQYIIGKNDLILAKKLINAGGEHRKFLRQIFVSVDITAPRYWWTEFDTYKVGVVENSESTSHTIMKKPITYNMFAHDETDENIVSTHWADILFVLNYLIEQYNQTKDTMYFRLLKQVLPESFLQKRTCTLNYENIFNMRSQRKTHKLSEWREDFINWADSLPYVKELFE